MRYIAQDPNLAKNQIINSLGLLAYNLGEQYETGLGVEDTLGPRPLDIDQLWTSTFMDIELQVSERLCL